MPLGELGADGLGVPRRYLHTNPWQDGAKAETMTSEVETPSDPANDGPRPLPEIEMIFGALVTAASTAGLTDLQALVAAALCEAMTGVVLDPHACLYVTPPQLAEAIGHEDEFFRNRIVQSMMLLGLLVKPFPIEVGRRIGDYAEALKLDERMHQDLHNFSPAAFDAAIVDFARNGYVGEFLEHARPVLHTDHDIGDGWGAVEDDPELAQRWDDLKSCPAGSLGRSVFDFYQSRHFVFPGQIRSATIGAARLGARHRRLRDHARERDRSLRPDRLG